jgi:hypothetical protein
METRFVFAGRSGASYEFTVYLNHLRWRRWQGLYMFARLDLFGATKIFYIGESFCLHTRLQNHERWAEARKRGATHVFVRECARYDVRLKEEKDLIKALHPKLNSVHRLSVMDTLPEEERRRRMVERGYEGAL